MLLHQASGELIHPIHVHNALMPLPSHVLQDQQHDESFAFNLLAGLVPNTQDHKMKIQSQQHQLQPIKDDISKVVVNTPTYAAATEVDAVGIGVDVVHPPSIQAPIINTDPIAVVDKN